MEESERSRAARRSRKGMKATKEDVDVMLYEFQMSKDKMNAEKAKKKSPQKDSSTRGRLSGRSKQIDDAVDYQTGKKRKGY